MERIDAFALLSAVYMADLNRLYDIKYRVQMSEKTFVASSLLNEARIIMDRWGAISTDILNAGLNAGPRLVINDLDMVIGYMKNLKEDVFTPLVQALLVSLNGKPANANVDTVLNAEAIVGDPARMINATTALANLKLLKTAYPLFLRSKSYVVDKNRELAKLENILDPILRDLTPNRELAAMDDWVDKPELDYFLQSRAGTINIAAAPIANTFAASIGTYGSVALLNGEGALGYDTNRMLFLYRNVAGARVLQLPFFFRGLQRTTVSMRVTFIPVVLLNAVVVPTNVMQVLGVPYKLTIMAGAMNVGDVDSTTTLQVNQPADNSQLQISVPAASAGTVYAIIFEVIRIAPVLGGVIRATEFLGFDVNQRRLVDAVGSGWNLTNMSDYLGADTYRAITMLRSYDIYLGRITPLATLRSRLNTFYKNMYLVGPGQTRPNGLVGLWTDADDNISDTELWDPEWWFLISSQNANPITAVDKQTLYPIYFSHLKTLAESIGLDSGFEEYLAN